MWQKGVPLVAQSNLPAFSLLGSRVKGPANTNVSLSFIFVLYILLGIHMESNTLWVGYVPGFHGPEKNLIESTVISHILYVDTFGIWDLKFSLVGPGRASRSLTGYLRIGVGMPLCRLQ